jgi:hypothetical protein
MTKTGGLPKKTFLHPESDKDYYKRSSTGDTLGKSRKNLSFVVPVTKLNERLKDTFWTKLKSILPGLNSFDNKEITEKLEKQFLNPKSSDETKLNEEHRRKVEKKLQEMDPEELRMVNWFVNIVGSLTTEQEKENVLDFLKTFKKQNNTKTHTLQKGSSSTEDNKPKTKTKAELKDTSKQRSMAESTSDEDGALEHESISTQRKKQKQTQKPKASKSKSIKESSLTDKQTLQQESRTAKGKKLILKPTASKSTSQPKSPEGKKQTQNAKRKLKDDDSTTDKSLGKKPRLVQEQQMNQHSLQLEAGKRTKYNLKLPLTWR